MQLFVDFVDRSGKYRGARDACTVDPSLPVGVLTAVVFLNAVGHESSSTRRRVFHVEGGRFLAEDRLDEAGVEELDTLIVVNTDALPFHVPRVLATRWQSIGGTARRATADRRSSCFARPRRRTPVGLMA